MMIPITLDNVNEVLDRSGRLEGGNVTRISICSEKDEIQLKAHAEGASAECVFTFCGILSYQVNNPSGAEFFGLSGYPNSLEIKFDESGVFIAIGANEASEDIESLKGCNLYVHAKSAYFRSGGKY